MLKVFLAVALVAVPVLANWQAGIVWHDGAFAPFFAIGDEVKVGIMRNGTGGGDGHSLFLVWLEADCGYLFALAGARIDLFGGDYWDGDRYVLGVPVPVFRPMLGMGFAAPSVQAGMTWVWYSDPVGFPWFRFYVEGEGEDKRER